MEIEIIKHLQSFQTPFFNGVMWFFTYFASFYAIILFFIIFYLFSSKKYSIFFLFSVLANVGFNYILKAIINRPRPYEVSNEISNVTNSLGKSFPSGHMVCATTIIVFLSYLLFKKTKSKILKALIILSDVIVLMLVGISRMYFGQHYLSDLVAGFALAIILSLVEFLIEKKCKFI